MMKTTIQFSILLMLSLIWLAQLAFMPFFLSPVFCFMIISLAIHFKSLRQDPTRVFSKNWKGIFVIASLAVIYFSFKSFIGIEAGTAVLATFLFAKALETKTKRDLIILFNFALFVSASLFLHSQSIWMAVMVIACMVSCFVGLYRIQTAEFETQNHPIKSFKTDAGHIFKFIGLAIPFFVLLFLFFPRFPPLWQIPISSDKSVTGISDRMSPGDIAELSQSSALAFRIMGDVQKLPERSELYWRAMVLDQYDGTTWSSSFLNLQIQAERSDLKNLNGFEYQYLPADPNQKWVTALEKSIPLERRFALHQDYAITPHRQVQRNQPIPLMWMGRDFDNQGVVLQTMQEKMVLNYPKDKDLQAQRFAHQLFQQSQSNPKIYIDHLIEWYQKNGFSYTLKPGKLGENRVDEFLFKTKQGFCEHYASSFVLLLRYVGIPARVVVGYQGGQFSPDANSWEVRQLDAHAWTEVFLNGSWQRIDPTAIIAPQRIDMGMQDYISNDQTVFGDHEYSGWRYQQFSMLKQARIWTDYASFQWQNKIVGYDVDKQKKWMSWLGLNSSYSNGIMIIFGILLIGLSYWCVIKIKQLNHQLPEQRIIQQFSKKLTPEQQKLSNETFQQWMQRLSINLEDSSIFSEAIAVFQKIVYLKEKDELTLNRLRSLLKECASELKTKEKNLS